MASIPESDTPSRGLGAAEAASVLGGMVRVLELERFRDHRGSLTPMTFDDVGFRVARAFVVSAPQGVVRGGHAHRRVRQILFRASGTIDVDVSHLGEGGRIMLGEDHPAMLIEAGVWAQQTYLDDDSTLIVFADGPYEPGEYADGDAGASAIPS